MSRKLCRCGESLPKNAKRYCVQCARVAAAESQSRRRQGKVEHQRAKRLVSRSAKSLKCCVCGGDLPPCAKRYCVSCRSGKTGKTELKRICAVCGCVILNGNLVYCGEVCRKVGAARAIRPRNQKQPEDVKPRSNGCGLSWERIQDNINRIVEREQERIRQAARLAREKSS